MRVMVAIGQETDAAKSRRMARRKARRRRTVGRRVEGWHLRELVRREEEFGDRLPPKNPFSAFSRHAGWTSPH
jgi:hypothetical protein